MGGQHCRQRLNPLCHSTGPQPLLLWEALSSESMHHCACGSIRISSSRLFSLIPVAPLHIPGGCLSEELSMPSVIWKGARLTAWLQPRSSHTEVEPPRPSSEMGSGLGLHTAMDLRPPKPDCGRDSRPLPHPCSRPSQKQCITELKSLPRCASSFPSLMPSSHCVALTGTTSLSHSLNRRCFWGDFPVHAHKPAAHSGGDHVPKMPLKAL